MPSKRTAIGRSTVNAKRKRAERAAETSEQREIRLESHRLRERQSRAEETPEKHEARLRQLRFRAARARAAIKAQQHGNQFEGTSSLRNHLESKHPQQFAAVIARTSASRRITPQSALSFFRHKEQSNMLRMHSESESSSVPSQTKRTKTDVVEHDMLRVTPPTVGAVTPAAIAKDYADLGKEPYVKLELHSEPEPALETPGNHWSNVDSQRETEIVKEEYSQTPSISTVGNGQTLQTIDDDYNFVMSILPYLRRIPVEKKLSVRVQLIDTIDANL